MVFLLLAGAGPGARASAGVRLLSRGEFQSLAETLAPRVNLFRDTWETDARAEFFGGTTRDYLYWIKRQFRGLTGRAEAERRAAELLALKNIDVREFIIGDSDVDIVRHQASLSIGAGVYGLRKVDFIGPERFDPATPEGRDEKNQGYLPVQKIRLARGGFVRWDGFGDGIGEIYAGKITAHFSSPAEFASTHYAAQHENHPVLLVLRFLREAAMNYYQEFGPGYPDRRWLLTLDKHSVATAKAVMAQTLAGDELAPYLAQPRFVKWLDDTILKLFRSYTNPTAAFQLAKAFGLPELIARFPSRIEPINKYLFAKPPLADEEVRRRLAELDATPESFFQPPADRFPELKLNHGTRRPDAFGAILRQGILPSENGVGGAGLYGVSNANVGFAETWGGAKERVVEFE